MSAADAAWISGLNAVGGLLDTRPEAVVELLAEQGARGARLEAVLDAARRMRIAVQPIERKRLDQRLGHDRHQGVAARVRFGTPPGEAELKQWVEAAGSAALLLVLDGVTDPHNLGACLRSAAAAACTAVVVPKDRAAGLNDTVLRASAGTALLVRLAQVTNLARTLEMLKQAGVWTYGAAMEDEPAKEAAAARSRVHSLYRADLRGACALVLGAEGAGLRRLTRDTCDALVHIPMPGRAESLNVSVACGIMLFEALRQRGEGTG